MLVRMTEKAMHNCVSTFEEILALAGMVWYGMVWYGMVWYASWEISSSAATRWQCGTT
jgi:hypothetical protein